MISNTEISKKFRNEFSIYAFPLLNPDGADFGNWRHNANGLDINRDWIDFTQPETQMVKTYFENKINEGNKIRFALDFHTSYSGPYLLTLDSITPGRCVSVCANSAKKHRCAAVHCACSWSRLSEVSVLNTRRRETVSWPSNCA